MTQPFDQTAIGSDPVTDRELVASVLDGKRHLLGELYQRYSDRVYHKCLAMVKQESLAKDLTHDIFIKIFTNLGKYKGKADFSFWVYAITYNHCISHLRRAKRLRFDALDEVDEARDHAEEELSNKLVREMQITQLDKLLQRLSPEEEILLTMKYQDGMSIKQMAKILQLSDSAVKMRLKRTRGRLALLLKKKLDA